MKKKMETYAGKILNPRTKNHCIYLRILKSEFRTPEDEGRIYKVGQHNKSNTSRIHRSKSQLDGHLKEHFTYEVLHSKLTLGQANNLEEFEISPNGYDCFWPKGFNKTRGRKGTHDICEETRTKISEANKGKKRSAECRANNPMKRPEIVAKLKETCKNRSPKRQAEISKNYSAALKILWQNPIYIKSRNFRVAKKQPEMIDQRFGRLIVISYARKASKENLTAAKRDYYHCICDCGNHKIANGPQLRLGRTQSCGCLLKEQAVINGIASGIKFKGVPKPGTSKAMKKNNPMKRPEVAIKISQNNLLKAEQRLTNQLKENFPRRKINKTKGAIQKIQNHIKELKILISQ